MLILVAYASKHGSTEEIAQRIAETLRAAGQGAEVRPLKSAGDLARYDAFVIGSAAYYGSWLKEATAFVRQHLTPLTERPVWLFSSGPLGTQTEDAEGHDPREEAEPKEFAEFQEAIKPRDHQVFFGALDPHRLGLTERVVRTLPAGRALLPEGDFRDWPDIDEWARRIAQEMAELPSASSAGE